MHSSFFFLLKHVSTINVKILVIAKIPCNMYIYFYSKNLNLHQRNDYYYVYLLLFYMGYVKPEYSFISIDYIEVSAVVCISILKQSDIN